MVAELEFNQEVEAVGAVGTVYLLHFYQSYKHAQHYIGWTNDLERRVNEHRTGATTPLMKAVQEAGIDFVVARTWQGGRNLERELKNLHNAPRLCLICNKQSRGDDHRKLGSRIFHNKYGEGEITRMQMVYSVKFKDGPTRLVTGDSFERVKL